MKNLEKTVKQVIKRIEVSLAVSTSNGMSYDKDGNKCWRGKKLVDVWEWCKVRSLGKIELSLKYMPEKFEYGPLGLCFNYRHDIHHELEKWLIDYYHYLIFIGDKTEEDIWKHISK